MRRIFTDRPYIGKSGLAVHAGCRRLLFALIAAAAVAGGCGPRYDRFANLDAPGEVIVCFGDSITRGYGASPGRDYPALLEGLLGRPVINAGRDGDTTATGWTRLESDVLRWNPRLVIVGLGGNDLLRKIPREETFENLDRIVAACVDRGAMVVLVHGRFGVWSDPFLDGFEAIAERHGALLVSNALRGILGNPRRMSDQIHPNDEGYALLAERVAEAVGPLLAASDRRREEALEAAQ